MTRRGLADRIERYSYATKTTTKTTTKKKALLLDLLKKRPSIEQSEMAEAVGITKDGVRYHLNKLKAEGLIERVGGDKGGYWKIK